MRAFLQTLLAGVSGALLVVVLLGAAGPLALHTDGVEFPDGSVQTTAAVARKFYLTDSTWDGASALSACGTGYHFASLWEILDPSNLRYTFDHADAVTLADSGQGPPGLSGWIRTGQVSYDNSPTPGAGNCGAWTTTSADGTLVRFVANWGAPDVVVTFPWDPWSSDCGTSRRVWCVED
jgi:hypothetical protein